MTSFYEWKDNKLIVRIKVQPRASKDEIAEILGDCLKIRITAPPIDGKANQHLLAYLAKLFKVAKSRITLLSGETGREKRVCIDDPQQLPDIIKRS